MPWHACGGMHMPWHACGGEGTAFEPLLPLWVVNSVVRLVLQVSLPAEASW